ncbi:uncharacterized protein VTP21DRAFT_7405 [Calcarisporiella thermophila]|uniref:uncharacterized protein n=1 Tax=Calcarisporiella thermophila TaxID=911321 RepID=UPI0037428DF5
MRAQFSIVALAALIASVVATGVNNSCNSNQEVYCCNTKNTNKGIGVFTGCSLVDNAAIAALGLAAAVNQKCQNKQATVCCNRNSQTGVVNVSAANCNSLNVA